MKNRNVPLFIARRPRVEMVPLIDMFFLLLAFFIFGVFSMTMQQGILVDLPTATSATVTQEPSITISLAADGTMLVNQQPVTLRTLPAVLTQARALTADPLVVVNADRQVPHGTVIGVLDEVRQAGYRRVSFQATSEPQRDDARI